MKAYAAILLAVGLMVAMKAAAAPIAPGGVSYDYENVFTTRLFPGTPFNPTAEAIDLPVQSTGRIKTRWQAQTGDVIAFEVTSIVADGALPGTPPTPFQLLGGQQQTPQLGPFTGTYSQVTQDANDPGFATGGASSLESARAVLSGPFAMVLADGTVLYGEPYRFESQITSLPYAVGTEFVGSAASEGPIRVQLGDAPDPASDPIIGQALGDGVVRITRVIPEPTTLATLLAATSIAATRRRRRSAVTPHP